MPLILNNTKGEEVIDPYNNQAKWEKWKETKKLPKISDVNKKIILQYLDDMGHGVNISVRNKKGSRSYRRLLDLKNKMLRTTQRMEGHLNINDLTKLTEREIAMFFNDMRAGKIKKRKEKYTNKMMYHANEAIAATVRFFPARAI